MVHIIVLLYHSTSFFLHTLSKCAIPVIIISFFLLRLLFFKQSINLFLYCCVIIAGYFQFFFRSAPFPIFRKRLPLQLRLQIFCACLQQLIHLFLNSVVIIASRSQLLFPIISATPFAGNHLFGYCRYVFLGGCGGSNLFVVQSGQLGFGISSVLSINRQSIVFLEFSSAESVSEPKSPSAPVAPQEYPTLISIFCIVLTSDPESPFSR